VGSSVADAESLLRSIAIDLESMPFDERTGPLHLRVLALKRVVTDFSRSPPTDEHFETVLESLRLLHQQVFEVRRATSGVRLRQGTALPARTIKLK
jgi:hypothetical protein